MNISGGKAEASQEKTMLLLLAQSLRKQASKTMGHVSSMTCPSEIAARKKQDVLVTLS